jgi:DNA topoisomerase-3
MQFVPTTLTLDSGVTRPPPLLAEADLLSCMDKVQKNPSFNPWYILFCGNNFGFRIGGLCHLMHLHIHNLKSCRFDILLFYFQAGIGTDATMHDHIKKLLDRCYATKDENTRFSPTKLVCYSKRLSIGNLWYICM